MTLAHKPVLFHEAIDHLAVKPGGVYVDGTLGGAGHAGELYSLLSKKGVLIGIDKDPEAITRAKNVFSEKANVMLHHGSYAEIKKLLYDSGIWHIDGVLLDLGVSSFQLDDNLRGFSYSHDTALDMRMDISGGVTASDILNSYTKDQLIKIFRSYGEEPASPKIADIIVKERIKKPIENSSELVALIQRGLGQGMRGMTAVKRVFQALRIEVNQELEELELFLNNVVDVLNPGARIVIITFHSLEDRIVKNFFKAQASPCTCPSNFPKCVCGAVPRLRLITKKPIVPEPEEMNANPRAKSAKLRVAERI